MNSHNTSFVSCFVDVKFEFSITIKRKLILGDDTYMEEF